MGYHKPVMLAEVLAHLNIKKDGKYIDATLGDGGHTVEILKLGGAVLGLDYDQKTLKRAADRISAECLDNRFTAVKGNFKDIEALAHANGFSETDGILFDLGYNSSQLDIDEKGLSFQQDAPLDMRLSDEFNVKAMDLINFLSEQDITRMICENSDERYARRFAGAIVNARKLKKIQTTKELAEVLVAVAPSGYEHGRIHPATRTFQALRVVVNDEINNLKISLPRAVRLLLPQGRLVVISFQSKEDEIVKFFGRGAQLNIRALYKKPLQPTEEEIKSNLRARSAKMRVFEKTNKT